jgi:predicted RNA-binding Zn-ribbon protein involved in translation (DUF1610 family)
VSGFICPVCGFPELEEAPRTVGGGGSYENCPSCGIEFGWTDEDQGYDYAMWRAKWVSEGMPWDDTDEPPTEGWDPVAQLEALAASTTPVVGYWCPICGYQDLPQPPTRLADGSLVTCPSCGFTYGNEPERRLPARLAWRASWVERGMPWSDDEVAPPVGWDPVAQLAGDHDAQAWLDMDEARFGE